MTKQVYMVNGKHPHPDYQLMGARFEVGESNYGQVKYYATNRKLGCGKDYDTPEQAIRALCRDHAIQVIDITKL